MKEIRFVVDGEAEERYDALAKKGRTHKQIYFSGLDAEEKKDEQVVLNLQAENSK